MKEVSCDVYCLCSIHGLVRGENMELGRDSDTGGQVVMLPVLFVSKEILHTRSKLNCEIHNLKGNQNSNG